VIDRSRPPVTTNADTSRVHLTILLILLLKVYDEMDFFCPADRGIKRAVALLPRPWGGLAAAAGPPAHEAAAVGAEAPENARGVGFDDTMGQKRAHPALSIPFDPPECQ
jgi:hypothetical protein